MATHESAATAVSSQHHLTVFTEDVWVCRQPLRFLGVQVGTRMTIVRLETGALWVHSPVAVDEEKAAEICGLGPVSFIVAPNRLHHLFVAPFRDRWSEASVFLAPGLSSKRPDLEPAITLQGEATYSWSAEIEHECVSGLRTLGEVAFFHRRSRTLLLTDLAFNIGRDTPFWSRQAMWLNDAYGRLRCPRDVRWLFVADRDAFARSIRRIADWDFDRITIAHGHVVRSEGRRAFEDAFRFVLEG